MPTIYVYNATTPKQRFGLFCAADVSACVRNEFLIKSFIRWDDGGCPTLQTSFVCCLFVSVFTDLQTAADEKSQKRKIYYFFAILDSRCLGTLERERELRLAFPLCCVCSRMHKNITVHCVDVITEARTHPPLWLGRNQSPFLISL